MSGFMCFCVQGVSEKNVIHVLLFLFSHLIIAVGIGINHCSARFDKFHSKQNPMKMMKYVGVDRC